MIYDELIKRLRECTEEMNGEKTLWHQAADAIEELSHPQIAPEKIIQTMWIPVTERLPKENGFYLCLYKHKAPGGVAMDEGLSILQWINNKWGINDIYLVTHWMPLPQPPESEE